MHLKTFYTPLSSTEGSTYGESDYKRNNNNNNKTTPFVFLHFCIQPPNTDSTFQQSTKTINKNNK